MCHLRETEPAPLTSSHSLGVDSLGCSHPYKKWIERKQSNKCSVDELVQSNKFHYRLVPHMATFQQIWHMGKHQIQSHVVKPLPTPFVPGRYPKKRREERNMTMSNGPWSFHISTSVPTMNFLQCSSYFSTGHHSKHQAGRASALTWYWWDHALLKSVIAISNHCSYKLIAAAVKANHWWYLLWIWLNLLSVFWHTPVVGKPYCTES